MFLIRLNDAEIDSKSSDGRTCVRASARTRASTKTCQRCYLLYQKSKALHLRSCAELSPLPTQACNDRKSLWQSLAERLLSCRDRGLARAHTSHRRSLAAQ